MFALEDKDGHFVSDEESGHDLDYDTLDSAIWALNHYGALKIVEFLSDGLRFTMSLDVAEERLAAERAGLAYELPAHLLQVQGPEPRTYFTFGELGLGDVFHLKGSPAVYVKRGAGLAVKLGPRDIPEAVASVPANASVLPTGSAAERISSVLEMNVGDVLVLPGYRT